MSANHLSLIHSTLNALSLRNHVIASNISNVNTPGYKAGRVQFEEIIKQQIRDAGLSGIQTSPMHLPIGKLDGQIIAPKIVSDASLAYREDGSSVDLDHELALLEQTKTKYLAVIKSLDHHFNTLRTVISEKV